MSPRLQSIALTKWDQIWNCVTGQMKFPAPQILETSEPGSRARAGQVIALAIQLVESGDERNYNAVAHENGIKPDSLKAAISRARKRRGIGRKQEVAA